MNETPLSTTKQGSLTTANQKPLFQFYFLTNTLFNSTFIENDLLKLPSSQEDISSAYANIKALYAAKAFKQMKEATLEVEFIHHVLRDLGWEFVYQAGYSIQGKNSAPDYSLLPSTELKKEYYDAPDGSKLPMVTAFCESKEYNAKLDTGKVDRNNNPHFQIIDYLSLLRVRFGILTNARTWRLYDASVTSKTKSFYEIDLETILEQDDQEAFQYFYHIFKKSAFVQAAPEKLAPIDEIKELSIHITLAVEENLKAVIYGTSGEDSIFETIGKSLFKANPTASMDDVYENSMVLLFRLLFIVYFEDNNTQILREHQGYSFYALQSIFNSLSDDPDSFVGWHRLNNLFRVLDEGAESINIPLFNGGLFDRAKAHLLRDTPILDDVTLKSILERMLYKTEKGAVLFNCRRDYKSIAVIHLGRIYEGLMEFCFEVAQENALYLEYVEKGSKTKTLDGYFDYYDFEVIKKTHIILKAHEVKKGEIYLKSSSNSRKTTASYYTPTELSSFLVKEAVDKALSDGKQIDCLKIIDNACGSGHFLVEALNYVTQKALDDYEHNQGLQELVAVEKGKISAKLLALKIGSEPDETQVLKRVLLKRCIFGVDLNPFAVELARLSLWIDTFIFGTPLSFIEHHIKCGNALVGSRISEFQDFFLKRKGGNPLFQAQFAAVFDELKDVVHDLDDLQDATPEDVEKSKAIYKENVKPRLERLNRALNLVTFVKFKTLEKDKAIVREIDGDPGIEDKIFSNGGNHPLLKKVIAYAQEHRFFNYEIEFPEALEGFDCIMGNPPWDKTKFSDADFFPQYKSNYRTLSNSEKKEVQKNLLDKPHIKERYDREAAQIGLTNDYLKNEYPLNKGAGDGNLFRFFVEKNLSMLAHGGTLNYCLPSALMFEDGSKTLRERIFDQYALIFFYSFENREGIFPDVDSRYKFALMQICNTPQVDATKTLFYLLNPIRLNSTPIPYDVEMLRLLSPGHLAFMEMRSPKDVDILKKCYTAYPSLDTKWLDFGNELHMTNDKALFLEKPANGSVPLYTGRMIWQFNPAFESPQLFLDPNQFDEYFKNFEARRIVSDVYPTLNTEVTPQILAVLREIDLPYDSDNNDANLKQLHKFIVPDRTYYRLAFREIASDTNERTLIFSLLPKGCGANHKLFTSIPKKYELTDNKVVLREISILRQLFALAIYNSIILDSLARYIVQITVSKTYLERLPVPQPSDDEIESTPEYSALAMNSLKLTLANDYDNFADLAIMFGISRDDVDLTDKKKEWLQIENDLIVAKMYGITAADMQHIVESFKVLKSKKPQYVETLVRSMASAS